MSHIQLVIGGCRSGKSAHAQTLAEALPGRKIMMATAQAFDDEMRERIIRHQQERGDDWQTWEEPLAISDRIAAHNEPSVLLIDCLTLWISNMLMQEWSNEIILEQVHTLVTTLSQSPHQAIIVSNEVGMGLVPEQPLARRFRDLSGWAHQIIGAKAQEIHLCMFGMNLPLKSLQQQLGVATCDQS
jgi:adenosylcobinamide kinase/adenosylcobinamide-phosphate guanylyltransferase